MFTQLVPFIALATLLIPVPSRAVPGAAWVRRQEDAQSSLTLDPAVISHGLEQDGQGDNPDPGQVRSLTSSNNFINFCLPFLDQGVVLTDGKQVTQGSCNQVPMGRIISLDSAPRSKFVFPKNGDESIVENTAFTVKMKLLNMQAGAFVNAQANYYAAPQQVNDQGLLIGHTHFVIEPLPSLTTTEPLDPLKFAFFKGINDAVDGDNIVQTSVSAGLPAGFYRICSINTAANHQPALVSNAQHGALDDCSYFTIKGAGNTAEASTSASASASTSEAATATASTSEANNTDTASSSAATDSNTDAQATSTASDAPEATETSSATDDSSSTAEETSSTDDSNDAQTSSTDATDATPTSTDDASTPTDTPADNGNGNGDGNQDGNNGQDNSDNGQDNGNNDQNNGDNSGNNGDNNGNNGDNNGDQSNNDQNADNAQSSQDSAPTDETPAPTEDTQAPAPSDDSTPTPSDEAPNDSSAPSDDSAPAPEATPDASPSQGDNNGDNGDNSDNGDNNGGDQNQGGNNDDSTA